MSCPQTTDVGAYVLGALDPAERSTLELHLPTCADCRAALAELAGLPGLLSRLSPQEAAGATTTVHAALADGLLARAARRRTHRLRFVGAAAAAVVVAAAGTGVAVAATHHDPHATVVSASSGSVHARASLTDDAGGTTIALSLQGVAPGERCRMVAVTRDGQQLDAGSWYASYQGHAGVRATTAAEPDAIADLRVETLAGALLIDIPVGNA